MISDSQLWRGELWRVQPLLDNLQIFLPRGYTRIEFVNLSRNLKIITVDDRCTIQNGEFVWVRDGRLETGDIEDYADAKRLDKQQRHAAGA